MSKVQRILSQLNEKYDVEEIDNLSISNLERALVKTLLAIGANFTSDNVVQDNVILVLSKSNQSVEIPLEFDMFSNNAKIRNMSPEYFQRLAERNDFKTFSIKIV